MSDARVAYHACPLCEGIETVEHRLANCAHHPLYRPGLPALMRWLRCNRGGHVYTDGYWSAGALALIFANANPHQLPGNDPHGSRAIAARMVERNCSAMPRANPAPGWTSASATAPCWARQKSKAIEWSAWICDSRRWR